LLPNAKLQLALAPLALLAIQAAAGQLHVPTEYADIQSAIDAAVAGDEVVVAPGQYTGDLTIEKDITVRGSGGAPLTQIIGSGTDTVVKLIADGDGGTLSGFTISNGLGQNGGGLFVSGDVAVIDCVVRGNTALSGGGAFIAGSPVLSDVRFEFNSAMFGGGAFLAPSANALLDLCDFVGNSADEGGGLYVSARGLQSTYATIGGGVFENNAANDGGGICARMSGFEVVDASFLNNAANTRGGDIFTAWVEFSSVSATEFVGSEAQWGGSLCLLGTEFRIQGCHISEASSGALGVSGGAVYIHPASDVSLKDSALWDNAPRPIWGPWEDLGGNSFTRPQLCEVDFAEPYGVLDIQDLMAFVSHFMNHHPAGDLAAPEGVFDLNDLLTFIDSYYTGVRTRSCLTAHLFGA
jgi:hypothetical protein